MAGLKVTIKEIRPIKAACLDGKGPFNEMGPLFREINGWIKDNNVQMTGIPGIALEPDDPSEVGPDNCRYRVCVPIRGDAKGSCGVMIETLPGIHAACTLHKGPYLGLPAKWQEMMRWVRENGYTIADVPREVYLNDCWGSSEYELLTEIQIPVKK
ncbi:MAG TPA: GyrI-like domain-containing protein [Methanocella sp.]|uniref:GyrI-like domain-containing protein n=1 Tax=Methanocella sp. TaxID=2052833 RepID=UPI002C59252A|nr:GyrI-like domain-containing protein [Methanocella sp.]HTY91443.1 GyrI-like domain-containing protein [Methanocella sp.]